MKRTVLLGLMAMLSVMVFGLGISAAEDQAVSDNMMASIAQERLATEQTNVATDEILLAIAGGCPSPVADLCAAIQASCCDVSPSDLESMCGGVFAPGGTCYECGYTCD